MRIKGNNSPDVVSVEEYPTVEGYAEVRLRENIDKITVFDGFTEQEVELYEYDEYTLVVPIREDLEADIKTNLKDWLETGRTLDTQN